MGWKRNSLEAATWLAGKFAPSGRVEDPRSIFVLRNNDIGDLLVVTPLFEALRRRFPSARIVAGVGDWNRAVLANNPHVDEVMSVNAPWHNKQVHPQGLGPAMRYIAGSAEAKTIAVRKFDIGIDVLGSPFGSLLMLRAGIPHRLGVKGYAGGHRGVQQWVDYNPAEHVGRSALRFAELLGATGLPENRPQLFLTETPAPRAHIVLAPGAGFSEKCWPLENFIALTAALAPQEISVIGGAKERGTGAALSAVGPHVRDLTGQLLLSQTFAEIASARLVVCNSSMAMHVAAAFRKPCCVMLGAWYRSAREHAAQWGYDGCRVLGPEDGRGLVTVSELLSQPNFW